MNPFFLSGANPNCEDYDCRTPVHSAIVKGSRSYECVRLLLDGGADVNHRDRYGPRFVSCKTRMHS